MSLPADYRKEVQGMIDLELGKHTRSSAILSAALGVFILFLFMDMLFRVLGLIPPFMGIDVRVVETLRDFATLGVR